MKKQGFDRRDFLKGALVGGTVTASGTAVVAPLQGAQAQAPTDAASVAPDARGYAFFNLDEAAFIEALDVMA